MALTLFEDFVYWTDGKSKSLRRAHKTTGAQGIELLNSWQAIKSIKVYHSLRQPEGMKSIWRSCSFCPPVWTRSRASVFSVVPKHQCQIANGGCSHLCLLSPGGEHKCACPTNFYLAADNKTCLSNCTSSQVSVTLPSSSFCPDQDFPLKTNCLSVVSFPRAPRGRGNVCFEAPTVRADFKLCVLLLKVPLRHRRVHPFLVEVRHRGRLWGRLRRARRLPWVPCCFKVALEPH